MPIEIKELIIKTTLLDKSETESSGLETEKNYFSESHSMQTVVAQCVEAVLKVLQTRQER